MYARRTVSTSLYRYFEQAVTRKRPIFYIDCYIFSDIPRLSVTKHWQFDDYLTFNHRLATRDPIFHFKIFLEEKKRVTRLHELGHFSLSISLIDRKSFNVKEDPFDMREFATRIYSTAYTTVFLFFTFFYGVPSRAALGLDEHNAGCEKWTV